MANAPGGFDQNMIDELAPFLSTCSNLIMGFRNEVQRQEAEKTRKKAQDELVKAKESAEWPQWRGAFQGEMEGQLSRGV